MRYTVQNARQARIRFSALLIAVALLVMGNGLQTTLLGVRAGLEGMNEAMIGLIMSGYFFGFALGSVGAPRLIAAVGHIRAFAALASIASAAALAHAIFVDAWTWLVLRGVTGACYAGMVIVVESWLNASTDRSNRGRVLASYGIVFYAAWAGSQPMLNLSPVDGFVLFALVSIILSLALVPITLTRAGVPGAVEAERARLRRLYQLSPMGLSGAFALGLVVSAFWGMGPTFAQQIGMTDAEISLFLSLMVVGALVLQWPLGWLSDRIDRRWVILAASASGGLLTAGLVWLASAGSAALYPAIFFIGGLVMPMYSLCVAHVNDHVEPREVVAASSGLIMVYGVGSALGPFCASLLMGTLGPRGLFVFMSGILGIFAVYSIRRLLVSEAPTREQKDSYVSVPQTSHAVLPLHKHSSEKPGRTTAPQ